MIPLVDVKAQNTAIADELQTAIAEVFTSCWFSGGPVVERFEAHFAAAHDVAHAVGVNSGTAALHATMMALGIGSGDEVIVPSHTFFATVEAVLLVGATPVFADSDAARYTLDPAQIAALATPRTRAVIPVHLYGQAADMPAICAAADRLGIAVVEDCSQAHLATCGGQKVGSFGVAGCFSFYPGKNLGACGEGGAVITRDAALAEDLRCIRNHGMKKRYHHDMIGHNFRMDAIQAAVLDVKLRYLPEWTRQRQRVAAWYDSAIAAIPGCTTPLNVEGDGHVYHLYVIRHAQRDDLQQYLFHDSKIDTGIHYPIPCHLAPALAGRAGCVPGSLPRCEAFCDEILSLPMHPELTDDQLQRIAAEIAVFQARTS